MKKDKIRPLLEVEKSLEWHRWMNEIPFLSVPSHWKVEAIPPFHPGIIRYHIRTDKMAPTEKISIYLDCYELAGYMGQPYWEVYPIDGDCARVRMNDTERLLQIITKAIGECEASASQPKDDLA